MAVKVTNKKMQTQAGPMRKSNSEEYDKSAHPLTAREIAKYKKQAKAKKKKKEN